MRTLSALIFAALLGGACGASHPPVLGRSDHRLTECEVAGCGANGTRVDGTTTDGTIDRIELAPAPSTSRP